jgi:hypothetical protein
MQEWGCRRQYEGACDGVEKENEVVEEIEERRSCETDERGYRSALSVSLSPIDWHTIAALTAGSLWHIAPPPQETLWNDDGILETEKPFVTHYLILHPLPRRYGNPLESFIETTVNR